MIAMGRWNSAATGWFGSKTLTPTLKDTQSFRNYPGIQQELQAAGAGRELGKG